MLCSVVRSFSHARLFETPWTVARRLLCLWDVPGRNTGVSCHACQLSFQSEGLKVSALDHCPLSARVWDQQKETSVSGGRWSRCPVSRGCPVVPSLWQSPGADRILSRRARLNPSSCPAGRPQEKGLSASRAGSPARSAASLRRNEGRMRSGPCPRLPFLQETRSRGWGTSTGPPGHCRQAPVIFPSERLEVQGWSAPCWCPAGGSFTALGSAEVAGASPPSWRRWA